MWYAEAAECELSHDDIIVRTFAEDEYDGSSVESETVHNGIINFVHEVTVDSDAAFDEDEVDGYCEDKTETDYQELVVNGEVTS